MKAALSLATLLLFSSAASAANLTLVQSYSGQNFFNGWDFTDNFDNTTNGDVNYVPQANATASQLAFVNSAGHAIIKVDNTSFVPYPDKRNSVRIQTSTYFEIGTVWVFDAVHLPYGCSVWPSFWTKGLDWPRQGEIDIMEGINLQTANQMALHTFSGCNAASGTNQKGVAGTTNCNATDGAGCTVTESQSNSFGSGFASAGGGVWATQFDVSGIFIWFWNRANVPASVSTASDSIDISSWGAPSASYPSSACDIGSFFGAQQLVIDITLCGDWAGVPSIYQPTCGGTGDANGCYVNSVINAGSPNFDTAYFEINYVKAFSTSSSNAVPASSATAGGPGSSATSTGRSSSSSGSSSSSSSRGALGFGLITSGGVWGAVGAGLLALAGGLML